MINLLLYITLCNATNLFGGYYKKSIIETPCYNNIYCNKNAYCQYYILFKNGGKIEISNKISKNKLQINQYIINNNSLRLDYTINNYCKCTSNYFTITKDNICGYFRKSKKTAIILQTVIFPFGAGTYYLGWYFLGITTSLIFILSVIWYFIYCKLIENLAFLHLYVNHSIIGIIIMTTWFIVWLIGLILIIENPYDINGVPAK